MILLYIAIVCFTVGVVLILFSEFFEKSISYRIPKDRYVPHFDDEISHEKLHHDDKSIYSDIESIDFTQISDLPDVDFIIDSDTSSDISQTSMDTSTLNKNEINKQEDKKNAEKYPQIENKGKNTIQQKNQQEYNVVLFIDTKGIINTLSENLTENDWSSLTRIGAGGMHLVNQGINILINKKLYRYDFYSIQSMKMMNNYMLFTLKGKASIYCVLLNDESDILKKIMIEYQKFIESA